MTVTENWWIDILKRFETNPFVKKEANEQYNKLMDLYNEEFGSSWVAKEVTQAKSEIATAKVSKGVEWKFKLHDKLEGDKFYIGTKQVSLPQYILYCKGIYWMAGYLLIIERK
jgi:hypothetical protein